jgi:hypothetical protein
MMGFVVLAVPSHAKTMPGIGLQLKGCDRLVPVYVLASLGGEAADKVIMLVKDKPKPAHG